MSKFRSILPQEPSRSYGERRQEEEVKRPSSYTGEEETFRDHESSKSRLSASSRRKDGDETPSRRRRDGKRNRSRREGGKKAGTTPFFYFIVAGVILLLLLVPAFVKLYSTNQQLAEAKKVQGQLEEERKQLAASVDDLKNQLKMVNTDEFVEKYAHEKLGMIRPNEILVQAQDGSYNVNQEAVKGLLDGKTNKADQSSGQEESQESGESSAEETPTEGEQNENATNPQE